MIYRVQIFEKVQIAQENQTVATHFEGFAVAKLSHFYLKWLKQEVSDSITNHAWDDQRCVESHNDQHYKIA